MKPSERMLPLCLIMVSLCLVSLLEVGATVSCFAQEAYNVWLQGTKWSSAEPKCFQLNAGFMGLCCPFAEKPIVGIQPMQRLRRCTCMYFSERQQLVWCDWRKLWNSPQIRKHTKKKNTPKTHTQVTQTVAWSAFCLTSLQINSLYAITSVFSRTETKLKGKHYRVQPALLVYVDYQQTILAPS